MVKSVRFSFLAIALSAFLAGSGWAVCPDGDLDGNCRVDFNDVKFLADRWLDGPGSKADIVGSDGVNWGDFAIIAMNWGAVGEPSGSLRVTISTSGAIAAGAQWRVDGGDWRNTGATVSDMSAGAHTVEFKDVVGWTKPADEVVQVNQDELTSISRSYIQQFGSLKVDISPSGAVTAGAQWSVDGGLWQSSGATVGNLTVGSHTVDYKDVTGWTKPSSEVVQISDSALTSTAGTYVEQTGSLRVTISPPAAVTAGAQWRVDGGTWQSSGATVAGLPIGSHTVDYKDATGWTKPGSEAVQISDGDLTDIARSYIQQVGSLKVTISPAEAITDGAQWSVDGGDWQSSGATVGGLPIGSHTVDYKDVTGWTKPGSEVVQITNGGLTTTTGTYVRQTGSLQVTILPAEVAAGSGRWSVDGGAWQSSGATVSGLTVGSHTVEFKSVGGWTKPGDEVVQITNGGLTSISGTYIGQAGSLKVDISPSEAITAGAKWRVDGGAWQSSGATVAGIAVGSHTVDFNDVAGWTKPGSEAVQINDSALTSTSGTYVEQTGSLKVTITPSEVLTAGAQWRVDDGAWQSSGATVSSLTVGSHTVEFEDITGWTKPSSEVVQIDNGALTDISRGYTEQIGSLKVDISPSEVVTGGAQWRVDSGVWQSSGATVAGLSAGSHTVDYNDVAGWTKPGSEVVQISDGAVTSTTGTYDRQTGSLRVAITPPAVVTGGAQWRVDGGAWQISGATVSSLTTGSHTVEFKDVTDWTKPGSEVVQINNGALTDISRAYIQHVGSLQVSISPSEVVTAGAQWRVDSGAWQSSGATVSGLAVGSHTVDYKDVTAWTKPGSEVVQISDGALTTTGGTYVQQTGSLRVTITPSAVVTAGAQWRVDSGAWQNSGATVGSLTVGSHTVEFKDVGGWTKPGSEVVQINNGSLTDISRAYAEQVGSLKVDISPSEVVTAGAQWQVDGGAWQSSGATVSGLTVGSHTVDYKDVTGWTNPGSEVVQISDGVLTSAAGTYAEQTGSLRVTITPSSVVTAGAQWRVDGGGWQNSGTTVSSLPVGSHTVDYKDVTGWTKPGSEVVQIDDGALADISRGYAEQVGSLQVNISPSAVVTAGAQWSVDGGGWQNSGATVGGLPVGSHTIDYKDVTGWNAPSSEAVVVYDGELTSISRSYVEPAGSLRVTITPQGAVDGGAQWRVDGGGWQNSGSTVLDLAVGSHSVDFIDIPGWTKPGGEVVQVNDGEETSISRSYIGQAGSLTVYIEPSEAVAGGAQWRVDGGSWENSGATAAGLTTGSHTIEFNEITGWVSPTDRTAIINEGASTAITGTYSQPLVISEFLASNQSPNPPEEEGQLVDEDGDSSDWIEIYNPTDITIDLSGWHLTDNDSNLAEWKFPAGVEMASGEFLIVFASNKNRRDPGNPLHTNFKLSSSADYLALVSRDGISIVHEYWPEYPDQLDDVSYGVAQSATKLVAQGATARYHVPTVGDSGADWTAVGFDDSSWATAPTALSFEQAAVDQGQDVGNPTPGSHSVVDGVYTIEGNGNDIWNQSDNFHYVYAPLSGDGVLTARVTSIENTNDWAKAGVMIRETLDGGSKHAMIVVTPTGRRSFQHREVTNDRSWDNSSDVGTISLPYWVRIERVGNVFTGYYASDSGGAPGGWTAQYNATVSMGADVYAGLCVTSHTEGVLCTAVMDNVSGSSEAANDLRDAMLTVNASLWARIEFYLEEGQAETFDSLVLQTKYEDGYTAYLNGEKVAWGNAPSTLNWNSSALSDRPIGDSETFEPNSVMAHVDVLQTGTNVLAIHALNDDKNDAEFLILPELVAASESDVYQYFTTPTPGAFNVSGALGTTGEVWFSDERGFYDSAFYLTLSTGTAGAEIRYTRNGSTPSASNGHTYAAGSGLYIGETTVLRAVAIKTGYLDSEVITHTYIFVDDVITQSLSGEKPDANWPSSGLNGQSIEYGMDNGVVTHPTWGPQLDEALTAIPTMSIVTDLANLFDSGTGIYVNAYSHGRNWERPTSLELIYPPDAQGAGFPDLEYVSDGMGGYEWLLPRDMQGGFRINCGLRIRGGYSRSGGNPKHAFRLFFRSEYGSGKLNYPLFGDEGVEEFDKVDLRTAQNYSWSFANDPSNAMCREVWARDSQGLMGQPNTRSRYYHLYINGQYWGLYQTQERSEAAYAESYFGGDRDEYDTIKAVGDGDYGIEATDGTMDVWQEFWDLANLGFSTNTNYYRALGLNPDGTRNAAYPVFVDVDNLADYMIMVFFDGDRDAPISNFLGNTKPNNWYGIRNRYGEEGFRYFVHDAEHSMSKGLDDRTGPFSAGDQFQYSNPQWMQQELMAHPDYRLAFADRAYRHLLNGGLLREENAIDRFEYRADQIDMAVIAESARWGSTSLTKSNWQSAISNEINNFFPGRADTIIGQLRNTELRSGALAPLYPSLDPPTFGHSGGEVSQGYSLTMGSAGGTIYYTTDGSDPRLPVGQSGAGSEITLVTEDAAKWVLVPTEPATSTTGSILYEYWTGIGGVLVSDLTSQADYPDNPDGSSDLTLFEAPTDWAEQYGARISGYVHPPASGNYSFWISSDDASELWLSSDENPANASLIAYEDSWSAARVWQTGNEHSASVYLTSGNKYYIEAIMKEGGGGDNLAVSWDGPRMAHGEPIGGGFLSPPALADSWTKLNYDHSSWPSYASGNAGVGYERSPGDPVNFSDLIDIDVESGMYAVNGTCYIRIPFVANPVGLGDMTLRVRYDDAFVAYINGSEVARRNFTGTALWNSVAEASHDDSLGRNFEDIDITEHTNKLQTGDNVLAIQGLNYGTGSTDLLISVELVAGQAGQGDVSGGATAYTGPITLNESTTIKARLLNGAWSALREAAYAVGPVVDNLRITEIMYHPENTGDPEDPNEEFIELQNVGASAINLNWVRFTNGIDFTFPSMELGSGEYVIVVAKLSAFAAQYPGYSGLIAGEYSGRLDNGGERIELEDAIGQVIHDFSYKDGWRSITDGEGFSLTIIDPTNGDLNSWDEKDFWRASVYWGGSPGWDDSGILPDPGAVVINEFLSHSHGVAADWIELYNISGAQIDVGGWYLSDSDDDLQKYMIAAGTKIDAYDYLVLYENTNFGESSGDPGSAVGFALSEDGDEVYLSSGESGILTGYRATEDFGASLTGVSFGRYYKSSTDNYNFVAMASVTPDGANAYPKVGPIVISEIMYNPQSGDQKQEFIEVHNFGSGAVTLYDANENLPWKFTDGIDYTFADYPGLTLGAGKYLILAKDVSAYISEYGLPPFGVFLLGPYDGWLSNSGENVELSRPGDMDEFGVRHYIRVERVGYSDGSHPGGEPGDVDLWPTQPDGGGASLSRITMSLYGNDPNNWTPADPPTPGG